MLADEQYADDTKVCPTCGTTIHRSSLKKDVQSDSKWYRRIYCSRPCSTRGAGKIRWEKAERIQHGPESKSCLGCGCTIHRTKQSNWNWAKQKYCSPDCAGKSSPRAQESLAKMLEGSRRRYALQRDYVIGELEFLIGTDTTENLAVRLGYKKGIPSLYRALERWEREDLIARLERYREWEGAA